jgi:hypothetical protein
MNTEQLIKAFGITIGLFPIEIQSLLTKNGVVVDATNLNLNQLVDATFNGLESSVSFRNDFTDLYNANEELINSKLVDEKYLNLTGDNITSLISSGIGGVGSIFSSSSAKKTAQIQADAMLQSGQLSLQAQQLALEGKKIDAQTALALAQGKPQGNTMLYVALGIGGVLVLGVVIWAVTRKKE